MKTFITVLLMLSLPFVAFAQKKTFQVETGINYPIGLVKDGNKENHIGFYINGTYNFHNNPLSAKLKVSYESYTVVMNEYTNSPFNGRSIVILPALNYNFPLSSQVEFYTGAGVGVTIDNMNRGVFNEGRKYHVLFSPQVGVNIIKHFNISAQYSINTKGFFPLDDRRWIYLLEHPVNKKNPNKSATTYWSFLFEGLFITKCDSFVSS